MQRAPAQRAEQWSGGSPEFSHRDGMLFQMSPLSSGSGGGLGPSPPSEPPPQASGDSCLTSSRDEWSSFRAQSALGEATSAAVQEGSGPTWNAFLCGGRLSCVNGVCSEKEGNAWGSRGPSEPPQRRMPTLTPGLARAGPFGPWPKIPPQPGLFLATGQECSRHSLMVRRQTYKAEFFFSLQKEVFVGHNLL